MTTTKKTEVVTICPKIITEIMSMKITTIRSILTAPLVERMSELSILDRVSYLLCPPQV